MFTVVACHSTVSSLSLDGLAVRTHQYTSHETQRAVTLGNNVRLYVTVIVLAGPHEGTAGLESLGDHVVNETVLVPDAQLVEFSTVVPERIYNTSLKILLMSISLPSPVRYDWNLVLFTSEFESSHCYKWDMHKALAIGASQLAR